MHTLELGAGHPLNSSRSGRQRSVLDVRSLKVHNYLLLERLFCVHHVIPVVLMKPTIVLSANLIKYELCYAKIIENFNSKLFKMDK